MMTKKVFWISIVLKMIFWYTGPSTSFRLQYLEPIHYPHYQKKYH